MLINLGLLNKTSRKQFTISNTKIVLIHQVKIQASEESNEIFTFEKLMKRAIQNYNLY